MDTVDQSNDIKLYFRKKINDLIYVMV